MAKAEKTKQFIISKVAPIFNKKGVYGTSLSDITTATNLTKGAVYGNFKDKDQLAQACFQENLKFLRKGLYHALTYNHTAWEQLESLVIFYKNNFQEVADQGGCPLMNNAIEADDGYDLLKEEVSSTFKKWEEEIAAVIQSGQASGEFRPEPSATTLAKFMIANIEGALLLSRSTSDDDSFHELMNKFLLVLERELK